MPRYFFTVRNVPPSPDTVEQDLPSDEAAWREATREAGEIFKELDGRIRPNQEWALEVTDEARKPLFLIHIVTKDIRHEWNASEQ